MSDKSGMNSVVLCVGDALRPAADVPPAPQAAADRLAQERFAINLAALQQLQPSVAHMVTSVPMPLQWTFGRDGFLTALDEGYWWTGCSVPLLAGRQMLKNLELSGTVGCFVHPTHAGQLRACFERIQSNQAIVAIVPDPLCLAVMLRCEDFSAELAAGRLGFAAGWDWTEQLGKLFAAHPGLPLPQNFVRTSLLEDGELGQFTTDAQAVISAETSRRADRIALSRQAGDRRTRPTGRVLVVASGYFRLADLSGPALMNAICGDDAADAFVHLDPDRPLSASPLAVALAAAEADAVVTANTFRHDFPLIVPQRTAWITWVTTPRIAPPVAAAAGDGLLLADPQWRDIALGVGWSNQRIDIAAWPAGLGFALPPTRADGKLVGLLADTHLLDVPPRLKEFSSQGLLWEMIADELKRRPQALGGEPLRYLENQMAKLGLAAEEVDRQLFLERLVHPAYQQSLARAAIAQGLPLALFGRGWMDIADLSDRAHGPIASAGDLAAALGQCSALFDPNPTAALGAIDALGLPVIRPRPLPSRAALPPLSRGRVLSLIPAMRWPSIAADGGDRGCD